ncbi:hypothetical protein [Novosphingobium sp. BL-52-GroH]|uniref:hypothetical protein n=1 Tax=Novosphingobium sp. BL-52-GroH TaxID=3349877 RepID=UPI0038513BBB
MNKDVTARSLVAELEARLLDMETLGALVATAHLEAAIEALCRQFDLQREASDTD